MRFPCSAVVVVVVAAGLSSCGGGSSSRDRPGGAPPPDPPAGNPALGLDARPVNSTCEAPPAAAAGAAKVALEPVFSGLDFDQPLAMLQAPGDPSRWFVLEKPGRVVVFANDAGVTDAHTFLDLAAYFDVNDSSEGGLLGMAFHPDFAANGQVFLSFTEGSPMVSAVARFISNDRSTADPASREDVIRLNQPFDNHNGGQIAFGPDGYLYIAFGDGGSGGDPQGRGQDPTNLLGAFLRIDVSGGTPYAIPADNPFARNPFCSSDPNVSGPSCPEIYAWGLRNPWRFSFDADTGALWTGDVGQGSREEIDVIERGGNYGWNCFEGTIPFPGTPSPACASASGFEGPVHDYARAEGNSVTGGYVYRGAALPSLFGHYVFGDFGSGRIWRLVGGPAGTAATAELLLDTSLAIASFGEAHDRELFVVDLAGGSLHKIVPVDGSGPAAPPVPAKLSATGCVDPAEPSLPAEGLIPYDVAAPFWSDGASKERWFAIPNGTTIAVDDGGDFSFPVGSVLMKHFRLSGRLVETRLFMRHAEHEWAGYSYRWNEIGTDASLVVGGATADVAGQSWIFPSGDECLACHTSAAGFTLGLEAAQLDRDFTYPATGRAANQLDTLDAIAVFASPLPTGSPAPLADPYAATAALGPRARAYLHTNCAQCHRPGGAAQVALDLRAGVTLADTAACDAVPVAGDLGLGPAARIIAPGAADLSVLLARMARRDAEAMPPLATHFIDDAGVDLIRAFILSLGGCS